MKKKRILFHPGPDQEPELLAEMTLRDDGVVVGEFHDEATQDHLECGIFARGRRLQMSDGAAFFDGLELDYARSSRISVVILPNA